MPHVEQTHLPHVFTKQNVYLTMKQKLSQQGVMSTISLSHFYAIWDTMFSNFMRYIVMHDVKFISTVTICSVSVTFIQCTIKNNFGCLRKDSKSSRQSINCT